MIFFINQLLNSKFEYLFSLLFIIFYLITSKSSELYDNNSFINLIKDNKNDFKNSNLNQYNSLNNTIDQDIDEPLFYVYGNNYAVKAMNFEYQDYRISLLDKYEYKKGLKSDITNKYFTHVCTSVSYTIAAADDGDILFFGITGNYYGMTKLESNPRIICNIDQNIYGNITQLECGGYHTIILTNKNKVFGFGTGLYGQFGMGETLVYLQTFTPLFEDKIIIKVETGLTNTMLLDNNNHVWLTGKFSSNLILNNLIPIYYKKDNQLFKAIHMSIFNNHLIFVDKNNCLYNLEIDESDLYTNISQIYIEEFNNINSSFKCNVKQAFIYIYDHNILILLNTDNSLIYFHLNTTINMYEEYDRFNLDSVEITKFIYLNQFSFQLSNNTIFALSNNPIISNIIGHFLILPDSAYNNSERKIEFIRAIDCKLHCAALGQNKGIFTGGVFNDKSTCNTNSVYLTNCLGFNTKEFDNNIDYVINFSNLKSEYNIGLFTKDKKFKIYDSFNYKLEYQIESVDNLYFPKLFKISLPIYKNHNTNMTTLTHKSNLKVYLDLNKIDLSNLNGTTSESNFIPILNSFFDFLHIEIFPFDSYTNYGLFHIARGKFSKGLFIVKLDSNYNFLNFLNYLENIDYFNLIDNRNQFNYLLNGLKSFFIYGIYNQNIIFLYNLNNNEIEYELIPNNSSIIIKRIYIYNEDKIFVISSERNLYEVEILNNSTYNLIPIYAENYKFINIIFASEDLIMMTDKHQVIVITNSTILIEKENISHAQISTINYSELLLLYKFIKCYGVAADDFRVCSGHGRCLLNNECICSENYFGLNCTERIEFTCNGLNPIFKNYVCNNGNGICIGQDICKCNAGYYGNNCENYCEGRYFLKCWSLIEIIVIVICLFLIIICSFCCVIIILLFIVSMLIFGNYIARNRIYRNKLIIQKKESLLYDLLKDKELEDLDEDKQAWELNKKLFQINPSELEIIKKIGSGGEGIVFLAKWKQMEIAVKYYNCKLIPEEKIIENFKRESGLLSSLRHPNIITFYGSTLSYPRVGFILEYAPQSIDKLIESGESNNLSKEKLITILIEVCSAMSYLHSKGIIHRDLKWQNVLLNQYGICKITDFGLSKIVDSTTSHEFTKKVGTGFYISPENYKGLEYDIKTDVYSFGLMIFELLCGKLNPWSLDSTEEMTHLRIAYEASHNPTFRPKTEHLLTKGFKEFIPLCSKCWSHNPQERPNFDEIQQIISNFLNKSL